jgi:endonuclease/exonuclease/phosphatase family metal-dependent hydrolase
MEINERKFLHQGNLWSTLFPRTLQSVTLSYEGRPITITNAHITSPEFYGSCSQHDYWARQQLQELISQQGIILGDLNLEQLNLPLSLQGSNFATSTINTQSLLTTEFTKCNHGNGQMDYILAPNDWIAKFELSSFDQSDHFPVIAKLDLI